MLANASDITGSELEWRNQRMPTGETGPRAAADTPYGLAPNTTSNQSVNPNENPVASLADEN